jgi:hypothetical protein
MADGVINIEYGAQPHDGGWVPAIRTNAHEWHWLRLRPVSYEQALAEAAAEAGAERARYVGDWTITVSEVTL